MCEDTDSKFSIMVTCKYYKDAKYTRISIILANSFCFWGGAKCCPSLLALPMSLTNAQLE